ncbi:type II toxin-antitoxin system Phd/YefM family antitoxin [Kitasatospora sp. NPDC058965]|uniref:type II toxin-antitoxin system Phd/YefM family antitoxin n=1 Tax=Kitasatospora sp. NPDC058965 TaxID=3346682 RepID=UPI0036CC9EE4
MSQEELPVRQARARFADAVAQAGAGRSTVITRHGRPVAVLLGMEQWEHLKRLQTFRFERLVEDRWYEPRLPLVATLLEFQDRADLARRKRQRERRAGLVAARERLAAQRAAEPARSLQAVLTEFGTGSRRWDR